MYDRALGPIHFVQKDDETLVMSQEDEVTPELLNALFDTTRPSLVALAASEHGRHCDSSSDGALLAFDTEHKTRHEACAADVFPMKDAKDLGGDAADAKRYGITRGDDPLDEIDIGEMDGTTRPTLINQYLASK
ncbi:hypothetical protein Droror1_Dr00000436, partial [Drosera rotundifolia]